MRYSGWLLIISVSALASCGKHDTTTIRGQVVDRGTGQPVPGATVQLQAIAHGGSGTYSPVGAVHDCDGQGRFSFADAEAGGELMLMARSPLGHFTAPGEAPAVRAGRRNKDLRLPVYSPAWLRFRLTDEPPTRGRVWINLWGFANYGVDLASPRDTVFVLPVTANSELRVVWDVKRIVNQQAVTTRSDRYVRVPALDTLDVDIRF